MFAVSSASSAWHLNNDDVLNNQHKIGQVCYLERGLDEWELCFVRRVFWDGMGFERAEILNLRSLQSGIVYLSQVGRTVTESDLWNDTQAHLRPGDVAVTIDLENDYASGCKILTVTPYRVKVNFCDGTPSIWINRSSIVWVKGNVYDIAGQAVAS